MIDVYGDKGTVAGAIADFPDRARLHLVGRKVGGAMEEIAVPDAL